MYFSNFVDVRGRSPTYRSSLYARSTFVASQPHWRVCYGFRSPTLSDLVRTFSRLCKQWLILNEMWGMSSSKLFVLRVFAPKLVENSSWLIDKNRSFVIHNIQYQIFRYWRTWWIGWWMDKEITFVSIFLIIIKTTRTYYEFKNIFIYINNVRR